MPDITLEEIAERLGSIEQQIGRLTSHLEGGGGRIQRSTAPGATDAWRDALEQLQNFVDRSSFLIYFVGTTLVRDEGYQRCNGPSP